MKLLQLTIIFFVMYLTIGILDHTFYTSGNNALTSTNSVSSSLFDILLQPDNWSGNTDLILAILGVFGVTLVGTGIVMSALGLAKTDIAVLAPFAGLLFTMGAIPVISLYSFVTRNVGQFACTVGTACGPAQLIGVLTAGTLAVIWIWSVVEFWTWRITSSQ